MTKKKINLITKDLFNNTSEEDILRWVGKRFFIGKVPATKERLESLKNQAVTWQSFELYKLLMDEMKVLANKKIYFDSKTPDDIVAGKMILWTLDVLEKKIVNISNM